jgi:serpin B
LEEPRPFRIDARRSVKTPMLRKTGSLRLLRAIDFDVIELPLAGDKYTFTVVLPDATLSLGQIESDLKDAALAGWLDELDAMHPRQATVLLPPFEVKGARMDLAKALGDLGMTAAFDAADADFSGLAVKKSLRVSAVAHQAALRVDENGIEAAGAAASVVLPRQDLGEGVTVEVNRPFLFLLRDRASGAVLYLGRVTDPTKRP